MLRQITLMFAVLIMGGLVASAQQQGHSESSFREGQGLESSAAMGGTQGEVQSDNPDMAAICKEQSQAQTRFNELNERIGLLEQIIHNFGFQENTAALEKFEDLPSIEKEIFERRTKEAIKEFFVDRSLDKLQESVPSILKNADNMADAFREAGLTEGNSPGLFESLREIPSAADETQRAEATSKLISAVRNAKSAAEAAPLDTGEKQINGLFTALGWVTEVYPELSPVKALLPEAKWLTLLIHDNLALPFAVKKLADDTEIQLQELREKTNELNADVRELVKVKQVLAGNRCDTTQLVQPPPTSHTTRNVLLGVGGAGIVILGVAAAAEYAAENQQLSGHCDGTSPANACGACTCAANSCGSSSQCGGGDCFTSSSTAPFCQ